MKLSEKVDATIAALLEKPVAVFGLGASGKAVIALLRKLEADFICFDEHLVDSDEPAFDDPERFGLVIFSPAFPDQHPWLQRAREAGCVTWSELEFAARFRDSPTYLVTGTNGKTTLVEFIAFALKRQGLPAMVAGDNHAPLSRLAIRPELDGTIAICEISPTHAKRLQAVKGEYIFWTNFFEDHLDKFDHLQAVFEAHWRLIEMNPEAPVYAGKSVVENARQWRPEEAGLLRSAPVERVRSWDLPDDSAFATTLHRDALAPLLRWWDDRGYAEVALKSSAANFETRAHRLHLLSRLGLVEFWNDSKSSNFAATLAALGNFDEPIVWIGGGALRRGDLATFARAAAPSIRFAVLFGEGGEALLPLLTKAGVKAEPVNSIGEAVRRAHQLASGRGRIVFSPGHSATDQFKSFVERGISFENAVIGLKHGGDPD